MQGQAPQGCVRHGLGGMTLPLGLSTSICPQIDGFEDFHKSSKDFHRTSTSQLCQCWYHPFRTRLHFQAATILSPRSLLPPPAHPQITGPEAVNLLSKLPTALGETHLKKRTESDHNENMYSSSPDRSP